MSDPKPTLGRIVLFTYSDGQKFRIVPAVVCGIEGDVLDLFVMEPIIGGSSEKCGTQADAPGMVDRSWAWPPRG
jgi:hypothetical protein